MAYSSQELASTTVSRSCHHGVMAALAGKVMAVTERLSPRSLSMPRPLRSILSMLATSAGDQPVLGLAAAACASTTATLSFSRRPRLCLVCTRSEEHTSELQSHHDL